MARHAVAEFGVIQKLLAGASVAIYKSDINGESTGELATLYQATTGTGTRSNPQTLDANGQLANDVYVDTIVVGAISDITITAERSLKKIRVNPLEYPMPQTSALVNTALTSADVILTHADVVTTNNNVTLTNADVVTTNNNVTTTNNNVTATNADVVTTNNNVTATNADVVTTGNNATASANSAAAAATSETNAVAAAVVAISAVGAVALKYTFSDNTDMDDPGTGVVKFNHATIASVTEIAFDDTTADAGNPDVAALIASWNTSTNAVKGYLNFRKSGAPATYATFSVSAVVDDTGWSKLTVALVDNDGAIADTDTLYVSFSMSGDTGGVCIGADNDFTGSNTFAAKVALKDAGELTIATGAITITGASHTIDTEADAATDDLDTINGGADGEVIIVRAENAARTVVLKHNTGNIFTNNLIDIVLNETEKLVVLQYDLALTKWVVLSVSSIIGVKGADIASASPLVIGVDGNMFDVTGTTNFAAMTVAKNRKFTLQFDGILTVTHGSGITLPGTANYTTAAGDVFECQSTAADTVLVTSITPVGGNATLKLSQIFEGAQKGTVTALTSTSNSIAINAAVNNYFSHTMTENTILAAPSNGAAGQAGQIAFKQAAGSAFTLAFNAVWIEITGETPVMSTTLGADNLMSWYSIDGSTFFYSFHTGGVA